MIIGLTPQVSLLAIAAGIGVLVEILRSRRA